MSFFNYLTCLDILICLCTVSPATTYDNLWNPSWNRLVQTAKQVSNSLNKGLRPQSDTEVHPLEANAAVSGVDTLGLSVGLRIFIAVKCTAMIWDHVRMVHLSYSYRLVFSVYTEHIDHAKPTYNEMHM